MYKLFLPYDVFERHKKVGSLIKKSQSVLDVGGELNHLSQFCSAKKITVANLTRGDVIITKENLPFAGNSYEVVCSIDVLEHLPKKKRRQFVDDLVSIASNKIVLSFPIGTYEHIEHEKFIQNLLKKWGKSVKYLDEHVQYGLPNLKEIKSMTQRYKVKIQYSGNLKMNEILFRLFVFDPKMKYLGRLIYYLKIILNLITNQFLYLMLTNKQYSKSINRAYIIIEK